MNYKEVIEEQIKILQKRQNEIIRMPGVEASLCLIAEKIALLCKEAMLIE